MSRVGLILTLVASMSSAGSAAALKDEITIIQTRHNSSAVEADEGPWGQVQRARNCHPPNVGAVSHSCCQNTNHGGFTHEECKKRCEALEGCDGITFIPGSACYYRHKMKPDFAGCYVGSTYQVQYFNRNWVAPPAPTPPPTPSPTPLPTTQVAPQVSSWSYTSAHSNCNKDKFFGLLPQKDNCDVDFDKVDDPEAHKSSRFCHGISSSFGGDDPNDYLEGCFDSIVQLNSVVVQKGYSTQYIKAFRVDYFNEGSWKTEGSHSLDTDKCEDEVAFNDPILAKCARIYPTDYFGWKSYRVGFKAELAPAAPAGTSSPTSVRVKGELVLTVADPAAFAADTAVQDALKAGIAASLSGVKTEWIKIEFTVTRRLKELLTAAAARQLTAGSVTVSYVISIPVTNGAPAVAVTAASVAAAAAPDSAGTSAFLTQINTALATASPSNTITTVTASVPMVTTVAATVKASSARSTADPHMTNVMDQHFDLFRTGTMRFLQVPRMLGGDVQSKLTVDGRIDRIASRKKSNCNHQWLRNLLMSGTLLGKSYEFGVDAIKNSLFMRADNVSTESPEEFMKLAPESVVTVNPMPLNPWYSYHSTAKLFKVVSSVQLQAGSAKLTMELVHQAKTHNGREHESHLNFDAKNLKGLVDDINTIGGLLGVDDHTADMNPQLCQTDGESRSLFESDDNDFDGSLFHSTVSAMA